MTLFVTQTGETQSGLTTSTVLLWQIDGELVEDLSGVTGQGTEQGTITVHDDETELGVAL